MTLLHRSVPTRWIIVALVVVALLLALRVRAVLATDESVATEHLLEHAHAAYAYGRYWAAFELAEAAAEESPHSPELLVTVSDYAFVLGMSRYEPGEYWHLEAFETGLDYTVRARQLAPDDPEVHRAWAEALLLAYLYEVPVARESVRAAWVSMPVDSWAESRYRDTALRLLSE